MKAFVFLCAIFQVYVGINGLAGKGCAISINNDLPKKNEPLIMTSGPDKVYTLLVPKAEGKDSTIFLRKGESILLACPGNKNSLGTSNTQIEKAICEENTEVLVANKRVKFDQLDCKSRASATIKDTHEKCAGNKGTILDIGFQADEWHSLVQVCHNIDLGLTYFATHTILGSVIEGKVYRSTGRPPFSRGEKWLFKGYNPDNAYKFTNQEVAVKSTLGAKSVPKYLDQKETKYLSRGHLAPDADFIFSPWQLLTYFFVNAAPQWQSINAGHWLRVETNSRTVSSSLGVDMDVATGTHGLIEMDGKNLYLEKGTKLPVPEYYWKVLHNPQDDSCMGFIATNNPFLTSPPKHMCTDVCAKYKWPTYQNDLFKGYVYCCEYSAMKKVIQDIPQITCKKTDAVSKIK